MRGDRQMEKVTWMMRTKGEGDVGVRGYEGDVKEQGLSSSDHQELQTNENLVVCVARVSQEVT